MSSPSLYRQIAAGTLDPCSLTAQQVIDMWDCLNQDQKGALTALLGACTEGGVTIGVGIPTDPPTDPAGGHLYINTNTGTLYYWDGSAWLVVSARGAFVAAITTEITPVNPVVLDQATGNEVGLTLNYTTNKSTSGTDTGLLINKTDTASPGVSALADFQTGGVSKFFVSDTGDVGNNNGANSNFIGAGAGTGNTGAASTAMGTSALSTSSLGAENTGYGFRALEQNSAGVGNTALGSQSLTNNTSGSYNSALGHYAGFYQSGGLNLLTTAAFSVFLGENSKGVQAAANQIVIGYAAESIGANTVVLGNDSIVTTALKGNVGIGTTSPERTLQVDSQTQFDGTDGMSADVFFQSGGTAANNSYGGSLALSRINVDRPGAVIAVVQTTTDSDTTGLAFLTHGSTTNHDTVSEQMRITHDGKVGIGTASPLGKLHALKTGTFDPVLGGASSNSSLMLESGDGTGIGLYNGINWLKRNSATANGAFVSAYNKDANANTALALGTHGATRMLIDNTGNVGIGTTLPRYPLDIWKTSAGAETVALNLKNSDATQGTAVALAFTTYTSDLKTGKIALIRADTGTGRHDLAFSMWDGSGLNEKVRFQGTGNVGIGTTTPTVALDVVGAVKISTTLQVGNTAVAATPTATHTITVKDAAGTTYRLLCVV